ncbi:MAG: serine hydrolase domain-containing protein [Candidatus Limnocylindrales bacterium]
MRHRPLPRTIAILLAAVLLLPVAGSDLAIPVAAASPTVDEELAAKLQARLDRWRLNHRAPGIAAAVRLPDGSQWIGTSGTRSVGAGARPVRPGTPFAIASLTKTFMAALILQLREEGHLWLGTKISTWLPDYPKANRISVKMLLNHRSGIFDYFAHPRYEARVFGRPSHRWRPAEILELSGPRYCAPGKCYRYSNTNYVLLGKIVRKVTGKSPARNIRERFLEPLGLDETFFQGQEQIGKEPAKGYWATTSGWRGFSDGTRLRPNTSAATVAESAGALVSSVRDISDWQDALLGGELLAPASLELMLQFHPSSGYGLGMRYARLDGRLGIGHGGSLRGYVSLMYRLPSEDLDVVILTNLGRTNIQTLADKLTRATLRHIEAEPEPTPPPAS